MKYIKLFEDIDWIEDWEEEDPDIYKDYPEDFKEFLIKYDALENFHKNFMNKKNHRHNSNNIKIYTTRKNRSNWIESAFDWDGSFQNYNYWSKLNRLWSTIYLT